MAHLHTFEDIRSNALKLLGDVEHQLRSDWYDQTGMNVDQAEAMIEARGAIALAKVALDRAGQAASRNPIKG